MSLQAATQEGATAWNLPGIHSPKGLACLLIFAYHLAFYGPMWTVEHPLAPVLIDRLFCYGRMAIRVFQMVSGFLVARAPAGQCRGKHLLACRSANMGKKRAFRSQRGSNLLCIR